MKEKHIKAKLRSRRFSMDHLGRIVVQNDAHCVPTIRSETPHSLVPICEELLAQFSTIFGQLPGFRPTNSYSINLIGTFQPTDLAATLSSAPYFTQPSTPVTVRFSGITNIRTSTENGFPSRNSRVFCVRFHIDHGVGTDIISYSTPPFPTRTDHALPRRRTFR